MTIQPLSLLSITYEESVFLRGHMRELAQGQALLPAQMEIPMLEELPATLADAKVQTYTLHIGVFGFP